MNDRLKAIMEELPAKPPRSRSEPYKEFIEELRRRGRTYKDVANILAEKFSIHVTAAGIHDFVRRRQPTIAKPAVSCGTARSVEPRPVAANNSSVAPTA
jgi:transposase